MGVKLKVIKESKRFVVNGIIPTGILGKSFDKFCLTYVYCLSIKETKQF